MWTKIKDNKHGVLNINTQQYTIGIYVIVNNNPSKFSPLCENEYHVDIRLKCLANGGIILNGSIVKYDGEQNLNDFKELNK